MLTIAPADAPQRPESDIMLPNATTPPPATPIATHQQPTTTLFLFSLNPQLSFSFSLSLSLSLIEVVDSKWGSIKVRFEMVADDSLVLRVRRIRLQRCRVSEVDDQSMCVPLSIHPELASCTCHASLSLLATCLALPAASISISVSIYICIYIYIYLSSICLSLCLCLSSSVRLWLW
jgi:hypothetical protein